MNQKKLIFLSLIIINISCTLMPMQRETTTDSNSAQVHHSMNMLSLRKSFLDSNDKVGNITISAYSESSEQIFKKKLAYTVSCLKEQKIKEVNLEIPFSECQLISVALKQGFSIMPGRHSRELHFSKDLTQINTAIDDIEEVEIIKPFSLKRKDDDEVIALPATITLKDFEKRFEYSLELFKSQGKNILTLNLSKDKKEFLTVALKSHVFYMNVSETTQDYNITYLLQPVPFE
jgi:hypothetical protein